MVVSMVTLARQMKTVQADYLIILGSLDKRMGMEMGTSGSKEGPSPVARAAAHSTAVGESSEAAVAVIERYIERMAEVSN
jgi:hypothetical protein